MPYPSIRVKKIKKRDGRIVDFDPYRIELAVERAMIAVGKYDRDTLEKVVSYILKLIDERFEDKEIPDVEHIQDIVELALVKFGLYEVAKAYITYRKEKEQIRKEKIKLLGNFYEEEVAKRFSLNAIKLMVDRYLLKNEKGELIEGPKQMFERVAALVVIPDILYDALVYDKEGKQEKKPHEDFDPEKYEGKIGLKDKNGEFIVKWNKYHLERMKYLYDYLNERGHMKVKWSDLLKMIEDGLFDKYTENYKKYYELMVNKRFLPNSPTLFNAGAKLGQLSACFVIPIDDDMLSIMRAATEASLIFKSGGGIGINYSLLRPAGDIVASTTGVASGPVSFMRIIDVVTDVVKQGGKRRGANMGILEIWHPDIQSFIHAKEKEGVLENFNISVMITPEFWEYYKKGEKYPLINPRILRKNNYPLPGEKGFDPKNIPADAIAGYIDPKTILDEIAYMAWKTGDPGCLFMDNINRRNVMFEARGPIRATNPCVTGDTRVLTPIGFIKIEDLFKLEKKIREDVLFTFDISKGGENFAYATSIILPGEENVVYVNTKGKSISISDLKVKNAYVWKVGYKPVYKIIFEEGLEIEATGDHRLLTNEGWKTVLDLKPGDKVKIARVDIDKLDFYGLKRYKDIELSYDLGFLIGWIIGDGYVQEDAINLYFNEKTERYVVQKIIEYLKREFGYVSNIYYRKGEIWVRIRKKEIVDLLRELLRGEKLPEIVYMANPRFIKGFLSGLFSADGYIDNDGAIRLTSSDLEMLKEVQKLLLLFGILSRIYSRPYKRTFKYVTKDGKVRTYVSEGYYELVIKNYSRKIFAEKIGLIEHKQEKLIKRLNKVKVDEPYFVVKAVKYEGEKLVYDLTVPEDHMYISNGLISHNCGEQPLYPYESCNLGSINLYSFVKFKNGEEYFDWEEFKETIRWAYRFLDNVIDVNKYPIEEIEKATKAVRRVGLGFMGLADTLYALKIPYSSEEGFKFISKITEWLTYYSMLESVERAKERGVFPLYDKSTYKRGEIPVEGYYHRELWTLDWDYLVENIKKYGIRNLELTSVAPTGSISMFFDVSSGIEPQYALVYEKRVTVGSFYYVDIEFERQLRARGLYNEEILKKISENGGSLLGLEEIPVDLKKVFLTALDIPWWDHIRAQGVAQVWITTSISKTINMPSWVSKEDVLHAYIFAHEMLCKGITVFREGSKSKQVYYTSSEASKKRMAEYIDMVEKGIIENKTLDLLKRFGIPIPSWYNTIRLELYPKFNVKPANEVKREENLDNHKEDPGDIDRCPVCGSTRLIRQGGCVTCLDCGWSSCIVS